MLILLGFILSCRGDSKPEGDARRLVATSKYRWGTEDDLIRSLSSSDEVEESRNDKRQLADDDIFDELSDLISGEDRDLLSKIVNSGDSSRIRTLVEAYRNKKDREPSRGSKRQLPRRGRQELREPKQIQEGCQTTGYETTIREECSTLVETKCENITVTRFRPKIETKCTTRIDQSCRPTKTEIPQQHCTPRYEKRCEHHYQTIEEKSYNEECEEEIKHVCKERVTVPVEVPYPIQSPYYAYDHKEASEQKYRTQEYIPTTPYPRQPKSFEDHHHHTPTPHYKSPQHPTPYPYIQDPTPHPYQNDYAHLTPHSHNNQPTHPTPYLHQENPLNPTPYLHYKEPIHTTPYPHHQFDPLHHNENHHEPQGVTINPHGAVHHDSTIQHFTRKKRDSKAEAESDPKAEAESDPKAEAESDPKSDGDSQFGNLIYGDLFKRIIEKVDSSKMHADRILERNGQRMFDSQEISRTKGPDILGGIVHLNPRTQGIKDVGRIRERTIGRDINGLRGSLRNQQHKQSIGENINKFSNLQRSPQVNSKLREALGSPIIQSDVSRGLLHGNSQFSNILSTSSPNFSTQTLASNLRELSPTAFGNRFGNNAGSVSNLLSDASQDRTLEERVRKAMLNVLKDVPELGVAFNVDDFKFDTEDNVAITQIKAGRFPEEKIVHATIEHDPHLGGHLKFHEDTPNHDHIHHEIHSHQPILDGHHTHHYDPHQSHPGDHLEKPVPTVTIVELPAEPGCRSFSTKTCHKIPIVVPKKVPYEECRNVPAVDCFFVLKTVDDIECSPKSFEDCTDTAVEVPYLDQEEQCEDIEYDDCVDVEEQVPIQVCKVVDPDRKPIINREIAGTQNRKGGRRTGTVSRPINRLRSRNGK